MYQPEGAVWGAGPLPWILTPLRPGHPAGPHVQPEGGTWDTCKSMQSTTDAVSLVFGLFAHFHLKVHTLY